MATASIARVVAGAGQNLFGWKADGLASALRDNTAPEDVGLHWNRLGSPGFQLVFNALAANTSVRALWVPDAGVDDAAVAVLAGALRENRTLVKLELGGNPITAAGARALAEALEVNTTLRVLSLDETYVDDAGADAFAAALPVNKGLQELDLSRTPISDEAARRLNASAARSRTMRDLQVHGASVFMRVAAGCSGGGASGAVNREAERAVRRLSNSNFKNAYDRVEAFHDAADLKLGLARILTAIGDKKGIRQNAQNELIRKLESLIDSHADGKAALGAAAIWTSDKEMQGVTFYGAVQQVLREDEPGKLLEDVIRYCRTFNEFVVGPRSRRQTEPPVLLTGLVWAYENDAGLTVQFSAQDGQMLEDAKSRGVRQLTTKDLTWNTTHSTEYTFDFDKMTQTNNDSRKVRPIHRIDADVVQGALPSAMVTHRGCWMPREWVEWFQTDEAYRYPGYIPSSDEEEVAKRFIKWFAPAEHAGMVPVLFKFHFDPNRGCQHLNLLETYTAIPGEREWLFQHYSAFRVKRAADLAGGYCKDSPVVIELHVFPDSHDVAEDLPLAKWH